MRVAFHCADGAVAIPSNEMGGTIKFKPIELRMKLY